MTRQRGRLAGRAENGSRAKRMIDIGARARGGAEANFIPPNHPHSSRGKQEQRGLARSSSLLPILLGRQQRSLVLCSICLLRSIVHPDTRIGLTQGAERHRARRVPSRRVMPQIDTLQLLRTLYKRRYWRQLFAKQASGHGWHLEADETEGGREGEVPLMPYQVILSNTRFPLFPLGPSPHVTRLWFRIWK